MTPPDSGGLEAANTAFYENFESLDLDTMMALWDDSDEVFCVHPGAELVVGWGPVRRSWAAIFAATSYLQFIVTDVRCSAAAELGWVTCTENILSAAGKDHLGGARAVATNLFVRRDDGWRVQAHHASPVVRASQSE